MSPDGVKPRKVKNAITISEDDQLVKIIEVLGKDIDMSFIEDPNAKTYCNLVHETVECNTAKSLKKRFSASSPEMLDILKQMLQFNP